MTMLAEFLGLARQPQRRATVENPSVDLNDPDSWEDMFGAGTVSDSGVAVTETRSLEIAAVWQAVSMISGDIAKLPLDVYRREDDRSREKDKKHPGWKVVRRKANREKHAFYFWRDLMTHALLWNNAYAYVARNGRGEPSELLNLLPDRTKAERVDGELVYVTESQHENGDPWLRVMPAMDVIHIRGISLDGCRGADMVRYARQAWGLGLAAQKFASRFFRHGVRTGGVLEIPNTLSPTARNNVEEGFRKYHEGEENWFKTVILRDGAKFHQNSIAPNEGQMTETREEQVREVARYYNAPASKFGLTDSVSYNSKSEDNRAYLESTLEPWLSAITSECYCKLLSNEQQKADSHYFEHNTSALLRMNALDRHNVYVMGLRNRVYTRNEVRAWENLNPVEGGDEFDDFPTTGGMPSDGGADNQPTDPGGEPESEESGDDQRHALRRVVYLMTEQARQKSAKSASAFVEWLDGGLTSHRERAESMLGTDSVVCSFVERLNAVVSEVSADGLVEAVECTAAELERSV